MIISGPSLSKNSPEIITKLNSISPKIAAKDYTLWGENTEAISRLGWVDLPNSSRDLLPQLDALSAWARSNKLVNVVLCGMGGSSLAPEVIAASYGKRLTVIDSTDPAQLLRSVPSDLSRSVIIISSKSGSTIETISQFAYLADLLTKANLKPSDHIVIVTDPGTSLDIEARKDGFRVINADPNVGGRFSALSAFGLVPASLLGIDISVLLDDAQDAATTFVSNNSPAVLIAAALYSNTEQFINFNDTNSDLPGISDWIEQLIAESTGKNQQGRLPIVIKENSYFDNNLRVGFADGVFDLVVKGTLGEQFILWEWVTSLLCYLLEVDPFNQPNVAEAKERTAAILKQISSGKLQAFSPVYEDSELSMYSNTDVKTLAEFLKTSVKYFAVMAYLTRGLENEIEQIRSLIAKKTSKPTTFGWGPRFLHSTGQFHKGGQPNGGFIQITAESDVDVGIPNKPYTFSQLILAQALGDAQALTERQLPLLRIHLKNRSTGVRKLISKL